MSTTQFLPWHRWDRAYHLAYVIAAWAAVLIGFYPSVAVRYEGKADYPAPLILELHVYTFTAWLGLLTLQMLLVRGKQLHLHRRLGLAGALMIPVLVFTGIGAEIYSQRFYAAPHPENLNFFVIPVMTMVLFTLCAVLAMLRRQDSAAHKRLILLATTMLLMAAYNRWWGEAIQQALGDGFWALIVHYFIGPNLLIAVAAGYDLATRGRVHPVLVWLVPIILAGELLTSAIYHSEWWPNLVRSMLGIPPLG